MLLALLLRWSQFLLPKTSHLQTFILSSVELRNMSTDQQLITKLSELDKQFMDGENLDSEAVNRLVVKIRLLRQILGIQQLNWNKP
jgi:hypothetical protein